MSVPRYYVVGSASRTLLLTANAPNVVVVSPHCYGSVLYFL